MKRVDLLIPYALKDKLKQKYLKQMKWDMENKTWYYKGNGIMPEELQKYEETPVDIDYDKKDKYKEQFSSLKWSKVEKTWLCSKEDFDKIEAYRGAKL